MSELTSAAVPQSSRVNWFSRRKILLFFWAVVAVTVFIMACIGPHGWDTQVYWKAIQTVRQGGDPYARGLAAQVAFHNEHHSPTEHVPFTYVYSPITVPVLRLLGALPGGLLAVLFAAALAGGYLLQLWAGLQLATSTERRWLIFFLPFVVFFPGLLNDDVILSGNIAYLLYGLVLVAGVRGWKHGRWFWFYVAVLATSIIKVPLLTLLAFPVLAGRRQWIPAGLTGAAGLALFSVQSRLWPEYFREYMLAVRLQFDWNHDFGCAPAGILGKILWDMGKPFSTATTVVYLCFATVVGVTLLFLAHRFRQGKLTQEAWIPVALLGTLLLNPRVKEYDAAAFTVPMLLIVWRMLRFALHRFSDSPDRHLSFPRPSHPNRPNIALAISGLGWFVAFNFISTVVEWKPAELGVMLGVFVMGVSLLYLPQPEIESVLIPSDSAARYAKEGNSSYTLVQ